MLGSLLAAVVSGEVLLAVRQVGRTAAAYAVAVLLATLGAGFFLVALYVVIARRYGTVNTAVAFGLLFLLLAGVTIALHKILANSQARRAALRRSSEMQALAVASAASLAPRMLRSRLGVLLLAPAIAVGAYAFYRLRLGRKVGPGKRG